MNPFKGENDKKKKKKSVKELHPWILKLLGRCHFFLLGRWMGKRMAAHETEGDMENFEFCFN